MVGLCALLLLVGPATFAHTVTEVGTGIGRSALTDDRGDYSFPALPPGIYIRAELSGFKAAIVEGVELKVNQKITMKLE